MILIYTSYAEQSTAVVQLWLRHFNAKYLRITQILKLKSHFSIEINNTETNFLLNNNDTCVNMDEVDVIWYRRRQYPGGIDFKDSLLPENVTNTLNKFRISEEKGAFETFVKLLSGKQWLNHPATSNLNRVYQFVEAKKAGLNIPISIITNNKQDIEIFKEKHTTIVLKVIENMQSTVYKDHYYNPFVTKIDDEFIANLPDTFLPCCVQKYEEKAYEIRAFYLEGRFYSMAMFSQFLKRTSVDFRNYDDECPTRRVPYKLPKSIEEKLDTFMKKINLNCGSFDLIRTPQGEYVFLEVNPVGQFGMVSYPCNYYIEREIAEYLIKINRKTKTNAN